PVDKPRPSQMTGAGGVCQVDIDVSLVSELRSLAQSKGRTLYVTLLAAYVILLARLSCQKDIVVGTPVRGRELPEFEPLMGFFVNVLPLRVDVRPDGDLESWLASLHAAVVEGFAPTDVPFDHLGHELRVARDPSQTLNYQATF